MKPLYTAAAAVLSPICLLAADPPTRPPITGISHIALYCHDLDQSRAFYKDFLGFDEPYSLPNPDGTIHLTFIKINDRQLIELFPEKEPHSDRLYHVAIETTDATAMRDHLASKNIPVPDKVPKGRIGNSNYFINDPDGRTVEIVQYEPAGRTALDKGQHLPDTRISQSLAHVGILVGDLDASKRFYESILGFHESWRGSKTPDLLNWVHESLPDGPGFFELMLYTTLPAPDQRGTAHHLCLEVPDLDKAKAILTGRAARDNYTKPMEIRTGINRKRQLNLYDPDGTRVELMEPRTIDGKPAPPSTAPAPTHPPTAP